MSLRRVLIACLFAVTWVSAVLHSDLEAVGWMLDHEHGHSHTDADATDQVPTGDSEHEAVFARNVTQDARVLASPVLLLLAALPVLGFLAWLSFQLRPRAADGWAIPRWCEDVFLTSWQFVWRCAPESAAPPALS